MPTKLITRTIWLLSAVSLLAELASQMLYPILPVYLRSIGFSILLIGVLEGIAEVTAGLSNGYFGRLSDQSTRRLPLVRLGYLLSALAKPLAGVFAQPVWVFVTRTVDRFGKGMRTTPRDTLLSDESIPQSQEQVFGFYRSLNGLGAMLGPLAALVYLYFFPGQYTVLFMLAAGPGLLAAGLTFGLTARPPQPNAPSTGPADQPASIVAMKRYWRESPPEYRQVLSGLLVFSLLRSSDVFLLLNMKEVGLADTVILSLYVFYNLVYAGLARPVGRLADRIGLKPTLLVGLGLFAFVYEGMAVADGLPAFVGLLALYGLYAAATEGIAKAWISTVSGPRHTTTAVGTYAGLSSVGALAANIVAGGLWYAFGAPVLFAVTGIATLWVIMYLAAVDRLPRGVAAVRRPGVVVTTDGDLTGSAVAPYAVEHQLSTVPPARSAHLALILLLAGIGIGTVYMSYVALSTALRFPDRLTASSARPEQSGFRPSTGWSGRAQRLANPASSDNPAGTSPSGGTDPADKSRLPGEYDGRATLTDSSNFWPADERSAARRRLANPAPADNPAGSRSANGPTRSNRPILAGRYGAPVLAGTRSGPSAIAGFLTAKRPPVPWLNASFQRRSIRGISAGNSAEKLAGPLPTKLVSPRSAERRPVRLYTVAALYTHVYERPTKRSRKKLFLNIRKKVILTALTEKNGFIYVVYSTRKGQIRKGWLPKRAVRPVRLPADLYSS